MKELLPDIERWRDAGKKVAIATVVQAYGSAPRRPGAKMAIADDGEFVSILRAIRAEFESPFA